MFLFFFLVCIAKWTTEWLCGLPTLGIQLLVHLECTLLLACICFKIDLLLFVP
jgi:hypothetical protein